MKIEESANEKNQILSEHKAIIANYTETVQNFSCEELKIKKVKTI